MNAWIVAPWLLGYAVTLRWLLGTLDARGEINLARLSDEDKLGIGLVSMVGLFIWPLGTVALTVWWLVRRSLGTRTCRNAALMFFTTDHTKRKERRAKMKAKKKVGN